MVQGLHKRLQLHAGTGWYCQALLPAACMCRKNLDQQ